MVIKIGNKKYIGQCNALSYLFYRKLFKANIFETLTEFIFYTAKITEENAEEHDIDNFWEILFRFVYLFIYTNNSNNLTFEEWKEEIKNEEISLNTIDEIASILLTNFLDAELSEQLEKIQNNSNEEKAIFPEHNFLYMCIKTGLNINDLKMLSYVDVLKIIVSSLDFGKATSKTQYIEATQKDWDNLAVL